MDEMEKMVGIMLENSEPTKALNTDDRTFLDVLKIIIDQVMILYSKNFKIIIKDIFIRIKKREIDILIVVNMFLTVSDSRILIFYR